MAVLLWWFSYNWFIWDYDDILGSPLTKWLSWVCSCIRDYWICSCLKSKVLVSSFHVQSLFLSLWFCVFICKSFMPGEMLYNRHISWITLLWGWQRVLLTAFGLQSSFQQQLDLNYLCWQASGSMYIHHELSNLMSTNSLKSHQHFKLRCWWEASLEDLWFASFFSFSLFLALHVIDKLKNKPKKPRSNQHKITLNIKKIVRTLCKTYIIYFLTISFLVNHY